MSRATDDGTAEFKSITIFNFKPCVEVKDATLTRDFLENNKNTVERKFFEEYMLCPDIDGSDQLGEMYAFSNAMLLPYRICEVAIYPCTLEDSSECKNSPEQVNNLKIKFAETQKHFMP